MYKGKELENILPHKGDIILIDRIVSCDLDNRNLVSTVEITQNSMMFDSQSGEVPMWIGIEYMAQSIAALSGMHARNEQGTVKMGFVIGSRNYECFASGFKDKKIYTVKIDELFFDSNLGAFNCKILDGEDLIAKAQLNVFQPD